MPDNLRKPPKLELPCNIDAYTDFVRLTWNAGNMDVYAVEGGAKALIELTHEQARELFNWLGIMLHTYRGSSS